MTTTSPYLTSNQALGLTALHLEETIAHKYDGNGHSFTYSDSDYDVIEALTDFFHQLLAIDYEDQQEEYIQIVSNLRQNDLHYGNLPTPLVNALTRS